MQTQRIGSGDWQGLVWEDGKREEGQGWQEIVRGWFGRQEEGRKGTKGWDWQGLVWEEGQGWAGNCQGLVWEAG